MVAEKVESISKAEKYKVSMEHFAEPGRKEVFKDQQSLVVKTQESSQGVFPLVNAKSIETSKGEYWAKVSIGSVH